MAEFCYARQKKCPKVGLGLSRAERWREGGGRPPLTTSPGR